jgi:hypothetical protein
MLATRYWELLDTQNVAWNLNPAASRVAKISGVASGTWLKDMLLKKKKAKYC